MAAKVSSSNNKVFQAVSCIYKSILTEYAIKKPGAALVRLLAYFIELYKKQYFADFTGRCAHLV